MVEAKSLLNEYIKTDLRRVYGSVLQASKGFGIPYERFKKSLQRNRFNREDLALLLPGEDPEELCERFEFTLAHAYERILGDKPPINPVANLRSSLLKAGLNDTDVAYIIENPVIARRVVTLIHEECERLRQVLAQ